MDTPHGEVDAPTLPPLVLDTDLRVRGPGPLLPERDEGVEKGEWTEAEWGVSCVPFVVEPRMESGAKTRSLRVSSHCTDFVLLVDVGAVRAVVESPALRVVGVVVGVVAVAVADVGVVLRGDQTFIGRDMSVPALIEGEEVIVV